MRHSQRWQFPPVECLPLRGRWLGYFVGGGLVGLGALTFPLVATPTPPLLVVISQWLSGCVAASGLLVIVLSHTRKK